MRIRSWFAILTAGLVIACGGSSPAGPWGLQAASLAIIGPATIPPGATAAFTATAASNDGTKQDVTTKVFWESTIPSVVAISGSGQASALSRGEAVIRASPLGGGPSASVGVMVLPSGTYRLAGQVTESGLEVLSANVTVTTGIGGGLSAVTDANGQYVLYGVAGRVDVQASKAGYTPLVQSLVVNSNTSLNFAVTSAIPERDLAGTYAMTMSADPSCPTPGPGSLPADVRHRRYIATITGTAPTFHVTLSGANFYVLQGTGNGFSGRVAPDSITFHIDNGSYSPNQPELVEMLPDGPDLIISGDGTLVDSGTDFVGTFSGEFLVSGVAFPNPLPRCDATSHQIALTRQSGSASTIRR